MAHSLGDAQSRTIKFKCTYSATVVDTLKRRGWVEVKDGADDWDVFFCDLNQLREVFSYTMCLAETQRVAHFRNCFEISRKNLMVKNLRRLKLRIERAFGKEEAQKCNFFPLTFVLPCEHKVFLQEFKNLQSENALWIIKPAAGAQGKGIFIFQKLKDYLTWRQKFDYAPDPYENLRPTTPTKPPNTSSKDDLLCCGSSSDLTSGGNPAKKSEVDPNLFDPTGVKEANLRPSEIYVVQRYIDNPYLIGGRKFDIRFYVLVTSFSPLKAWIYREGFARFSGGQYSLESLENIYVHLTNVAVQKTSEDYNPEKGSKWSLRSLREYLNARHGKDQVQKMMNSIDNIVVRTLQSAHQLIIQDKRCFEIYGFDVLIDATLTPWLLEVNAAPAFTPSNEEDYRLKCALVDDTAHVLDLENRLTGFEKRVGGFDLFWSDGPVHANPGDCCYAHGFENSPKLNTFLGCLNDRVQQLRQILLQATYLKEAQSLISSSAFCTPTLPQLTSYPIKESKTKKDNQNRRPPPAWSSPKPVFTSKRSTMSTSALPPRQR